jgi:hypothetical protein
LRVEPEGRGRELGELLSIKAGKSEIVDSRCLQVEPIRAVYYGVFFRDCSGRLQVATDNFYAERKRAEMFIELYGACRAEGTKTEYFIGTLSVPVSAEEKANA